MFRRALVFVLVFVLAGAACLTYVFARAPIYVATARVQVDFPAGQQGDVSSTLLQSTQALTAGAMLDGVRRRLGDSGAVSVDALRRMLSAERIPGASAIELRAEGTERQQLPPILAAWIEAWRESQSGPDAAGDAKALAEARGALEKSALDVAARRAESEAFREKFGIDPSQGGEDPDAVRLKELDDAASLARGREADAEARLKLLRESAASGKPPPGVAESPTVSQLQKQLSEVRLGIRNLEQDYTPLYLGHDPKYKSLQSDFARLEREIDQEKQAGARQALQKAEEEAAGARQSAQRLQEELAAGKRTSEERVARATEYAALAGDLAKLEEAHAAAQERLAQLEKKDGASAAGPKLTVLNEPAVPDHPDRPDYWRDASLGLAGSAALGMIAVLLAGFVPQRDTRRSAFAAHPGVRLDDPPNLTGEIDAPSSSSPALPDHGGAAAWLPTMSGRFSREVSGSEVHALWRAATPEARIVIAGLLGGLSLEELAALHYEHIDFEACYVRVPGLSGRSCTLRDPLRRLLVERRVAKGGEAPLTDAVGKRLTATDLEGLIADAARDAGLANAGEVTPETLRYTYFAYLARQGARFAEIGEFIGRLSPAAHRDYVLLAPPGAGRPIEDIDPVFPALRDLQR
jgi:uncharacterized protein involved in exopolysaccharide biosynthesis